MTTDQVSEHLSQIMQEADPGGERLSRVFRQSFDQAYDGVNTGRYRPEDLSKTESAHIGSLVEINIQREFKDLIGDGTAMDYMIDGHDVDCKYSKLPYGWMIPNETLGHYAMVCHANDRASTWRVGFVKVTEDILTLGGNRDQKRTIKAAAREGISWAWFDADLVPNTLLQLDPDTASHIMEPKSGQERLNRLFRNATGRIIPRGTVATVAMQKDYMKRVRSNGGARSRLQPEGIIILGDYNYHQEIAKNLGLPIPKKGDFLSVRVVQCGKDDPRRKVRLAQRYWAVAATDDPVEMAPKVPHVPKDSVVESDLDAALYT